MSKITALEPGKRNPDRVNVYLDGEFALSLSAILAARLCVGQELGVESLSAFQTEDKAEVAYQRALHFLSYRTRSEAEIRQYLVKHKVADDLSDQILARLRQNRMADDNQFARAWIENRNTFRPRGRRALAWELHQKGIPGPVAEIALADLREPELAYEAASRKARQWESLPWADFRNKLNGFLARRGFPHPVIASTVSRLWRETHPGLPILDNEDLP